MEVYDAPCMLPVNYGHLKEAALGRREYYQCSHRYCDKWWPIPQVRRGPRSRYCLPQSEDKEGLCCMKERYYTLAGKPKS